MISATYPTSRLFDSTSMKLACFCERLTRLDVRGNPFVSACLRFHELGESGGHVLGDADHSIEISDDDVSRVDGSVLVVGLQSHGDVDLLFTIRRAREKTEQYLHH